MSFIYDIPDSYKAKVGQRIKVFNCLWIWDN